MTEQHPITPPPELRLQWIDNDDFPFVSGTCAQLSITRDRLNSVMDQAARWGADQELEACCLYLERNFDDWNNRFSAELRAACRPKPPSLKEQALARTDAILNDRNRVLLVEVRETLELNRRALEQLDD